MRYEAIGFDLLTALLDSWSLFADVAGGRERGMRWHAAAQSLLRGKPYRPFEDVVRDAAGVVGIERSKADELLARWGESAPWPDVPGVLGHLNSYTKFIVTNCSERLGALAATRAGTFDLVMTAERAGAYKPDRARTARRSTRSRYIASACCSSRGRRTMSAERRARAWTCTGRTADACRRRPTRRRSEKKRTCGGSPACWRHSHTHRPRRDRVAR